MMALANINNHSEDRKRMKKLMIDQFRTQHNFRILFQFILQKKLLKNPKLVKKTYLITIFEKQHILFTL